MASFSYDAQKLTHELKIEVTGLRTVGLRFKVAAIIFRLGGWVAGTQLGLQFSRPIKVGDVVIDRYDSKRVTVERIDGKKASVVWFEGAEVRRGNFLSRNLTVVSS